MFIFSSSSKSFTCKPLTYQRLAFSPFIPKAFPRAAGKCAQAALIALSVLGVSACSDSGGSSGGSGSGDSGTKDTTAPTLTLNPESGASIGSASDKKPAFTATFSEIVKNVNATNVVFKQGDTVLATAISGADKSYTITPNADLTSGTNYTLVFKAGITDAAGNALVAVNNSYSTPDWAAPTLTMTPEDNKAGVSRKPSISLSFSETVTGVTTANVLLSKNNDGSSPLATTLTGSDSIYTLVPTAELEHNTPYYVLIKVAQIKDAANNALGSANQVTKFTTHNKQYAFTAWVGKDNSKIDIDGSLPKDAELYSYRNADCDIANINACTQGQSLLLNNQTITDSALNLTNAAYYKVKDNTQTAESVASTTKFSARNAHRAVKFKGKLWVIGGDASGNTNDVYSSPDGLNWAKVATTGSVNNSTMFSARANHQVVVFKEKLWLIGGNISSFNKNDVWSSADGINWTRIKENAGFPAREQHQVVVANIDGSEKMWLIGGVDRSTKYKDVWKSENGEDWTEVTPTGTVFSARYAHQVVVANIDGSEKMWLIGGTDGSRLNDVWKSENGEDWTEVTTDADFSARNSHQVVVANIDGSEKLWLIGGYDTSNKKNDVWSSTDGASWTEKTPTGTVFSARYRHQAVAFNNKLWVIGGDDNSRKNDVWQSTDGINWTEVKVAAFPARLDHQAVAFKDKLWVIGGNGGANNNDVWSSDDGISWTKIETNGSVSENTMFSARHSHQVVVFNDKLWLIGGNSGTNNNDVWSSADGISWTKASTTGTLFSARFAHQVVVFDNKLWVIAGSSSKNVYSSADGIQWDLINNNAPFSYRSYHQVVVFDDKMWLIGGNDVAANKNDVWQSSNGDLWTKVKENAAFPVRKHHQVVAFDGKMWVIGGYNEEGAQKDVWSSTDGITWNKATDDAAFAERRSHQVVKFKNKLWLIGGSTNNGNKNDVWQSDDGITWRKGYKGTLNMP